MSERNLDVLCGHRRSGGVPLVRDEHLRLAVVDDVGDLRAGEVVVDAREVEADLNRCQVQFDEHHLVRQDDRHTVATLQPEPAETVRQLVGPLLQLAEGPGHPFGVDDREPLRCGVGDRPETYLCWRSHVCSLLVMRCAGARRA